MRIFLAGEEGPIPTVALPDASVSSDLPIQTFILEDGVPFDKTDWVGLGYTHFEAWCVGAAGGRGQDSADTVNFVLTYHDEIATTAIWNNFLAWMHYYNDPLGVIYSHWDPTPRPGAPNGGEYPITMEQYYQENNPTHSFQITTYSDPYLIPSGLFMGGGGGGGGMQVFTGELADLPTLSPVVVGRAGLEADTGQTLVNGAYAPTPETWALEHAPSTAGQPANVWPAWQQRWPLPHPVLPAIHAGENGGKSSFNGDTCKASGGKGGNPAQIWVAGVLQIDGDGGAGGLGGTDIAGGGGVGSAGPNVGGSDGPWDGDIGGGGGGGHGGTYVPGSPDGFHPGGSSGTVVTGTSGGQGSFSFSDTSVYGVRQPRTTFSGNGRLVLPGGGGGARANHTVPAGSRAPGYSPDGMVLVRIMKIE